MLEAHIGVPAAGGILVAINNRLAGPEVEYILISGGENISSIEVEQTICAHPAVLECAVIGIPHERKPPPARSRNLPYASASGPDAGSESAPRGPARMSAAGRAPP